MVANGAMQKTHRHVTDTFTHPKRHTHTLLYTSHREVYEIVSHSRYGSAYTNGTVFLQPLMLQIPRISIVGIHINKNNGNKEASKTT